MRPNQFWALTTFTLLSVFVAAISSRGQSPPEKPKQVTDEFRAILKEVEEAYKAPLEVDKDVLDELRKQYRSPTPEREMKIFREIRRLYATTPELEEIILREIRAAYQQPTAEQEERVFAAIRRGGQLPLGTVPISVQAEAAAKLFRKLDINGDGVLNADEIPEPLSSQLAKWDVNRDRSISYEEYTPYYQASLKLISDGVASGEIPLRLPKAAAAPDPAPAEKPRAPVTKPVPGVPDWFAQYDLDGDGQVGLHEWRKKGGAIKDFVAMDQNGDGFLTAKELLAYLADQATKRTDRTRPR
jgi:EF hand